MISWCIASWFLLSWFAYYITILQVYTHHPHYSGIYQTSCILYINYIYIYIYKYTGMITCILYHGARVITTVTFDVPLGVICP